METADRLSLHTYVENLPNFTIRKTQSLTSNETKFISVRQMVKTFDISCRRFWFGLLLPLILVVEFGGGIWWWNLVVGNA
jgi:hypothetical protein